MLYFTLLFIILSLIIYVKSIKYKWSAKLTSQRNSH